MNMLHMLLMTELLSMAELLFLQVTGAETSFFVTVQMFTSFMVG